MPPVPRADFGPLVLDRISHPLGLSQMSSSGSRACG